MNIPGPTEVHIRAMAAILAQPPSLAYVHR